MKIKQKGIIVSLLTTVMCFGLLFLTGVEAKADNATTIKITYHYVKDDGNNGLIEKTATVPAGTTWGEFLDSGNYDEYAPEAVTGKSTGKIKMNNGVTFDLFDLNDKDHFFIKMEKNSTIEKYYTEDHAKLLYTLYDSSDSKVVWVRYEYYVGDEYVDFDDQYFIMPKSYLYNSNEALNYILNSYSIYSYYKNWVGIEEAVVTLEGFRDGTDGDGYHDEAYELIFKVPAGVSDGEHKKADNREERYEPEPVVIVTEPTAETIADPAKAVNAMQAVNSLLRNVNQTVNDVKAGKVNADTPAQVNLGLYNSLSFNTMSELEKADIDIILTYRYQGRTYTVKIPKDYKFDSNVGWYGPLYMYQLFGQNVE